MKSAKRSQVRVWLCIFVLTGTLCAQATKEQRTASHVRAPDPMNGIWEAPDGNGGAVGLNLWTESSTDWHGEQRAEEGPFKPLAGPSHPVLLFGVYHRAGARVRCMEENFFDTGWQGRQDANVVNRYTAGHLQVHAPGKHNADFAIDLDLWFDPFARTWTGRFHRGNFDQQVTLRPAPARPSHDAGLCMGPGFAADPDFGRPKEP